MTTKIVAHATHPIAKHMHILKSDHTTSAHELTSLSLPVLVRQGLKGLSQLVHIPNITTIQATEGRAYAFG